MCEVSAKYSEKLSKWKFFRFFPLPKKNFFFCRIARIGTFCRGNFFPKNRKFFHFFHKLENSENLVIQAYKCANFQLKIFSEKKWHPSSGILSKNFQFSNLKSDLFGKFSTFPFFTKIPKFYLSEPTSVQSFSEKKEPFSSSSSFIIHHHHHDHSLRSWLCRLGMYR